MSDLERSSGVITFVPRSTQTPYLRLVSEDVHREEEILAADPACWSYVGQQRDQQDLNLGRGCIMPGIIQHEFLHALGFWHPSSRWDRDEYVAIKWENIFPGLEYNFEKRTVHDTLGLPYDYASIMSYGTAEFSNGSITMVAPEPIGQLESPSQGDIIQLRLLYQCRSGPRMFSEYLDNPCTADCKCWETASGCNGNDDACQGDLVCARANNQCVRKPNAIVTGRQLSLVAIIVVGSGLVVFWGFRRSHRRNYQEL
jgi:hypothetical protein